MASSELPTIAVAEQSIGDAAFVAGLVGDRARIRMGPLTSDDQCAALTQGADALIVTLQALGRSRVASLSTSIRVIGRAGVGLDTIDLGAAAERNIAVVNQPTYATNEVATHAAALLLAVQRRIVQAANSFDGGWALASDLGPVPPLHELTLGVVGYGAIGRAFVTRMLPFMRHVIVHDPAYEPTEPHDSIVGFRPTLDDLLSEADVVSLHIPLLDSTRGIIGAEQLRTMKPHSVLVNVSRGGLVDESALGDALRQGAIGGAGLDVFETEPLPLDSPLRGAPNLVMSPHVAWYSDGASDRMASWTVDDVLDVLAGGPPSRGRLVPTADRDG